MARLFCDTAEEFQHFAESQYLSTAANKSGSTLPAIPKMISKKLVALLAYMAGLVAVFMIWLLAASRQHRSRQINISRRKQHRSGQIYYSRRAPWRADILLEAPSRCVRCSEARRHRPTYPARAEHSLRACRSAPCALLVKQRNIIASVVVRHAGGSLDCRGRGSEPRCVPPESLLGKQ
jgi:hypothetical protein